MTIACSTSASASSRRPPPSARAIAEEMPPPIAPADSICIIMKPGNTSAMPASASSPETRDPPGLDQPGRRLRQHDDDVRPGQPQQRPRRSALRAAAGCADRADGFRHRARRRANNGRHRLIQRHAILRRDRTGSYAYMRLYKCAYTPLSRPRTDLFSRCRDDREARPSFQDCNCLAIRQAARHVSPFLRPAVCAGRDARHAIRDPQPARPRRADDDQRAGGRLGHGPHDAGPQHPAVAARRADRGGRLPGRPPAPRIAP